MPTSRPPQQRPTRRPPGRPHRARNAAVTLLLALVVVAGVGLLFRQGVGPLPDPESCTAQVGDVVVDLSTEQAENAALIAAIGVQRGLPARAVSIALATAYQESKIQNLDHGDRDSLGLFQQRPSQGWGTAEQIQNVPMVGRSTGELLKLLPGMTPIGVGGSTQNSPGYNGEVIGINGNGDGGKQSAVGNFSGNGTRAVHRELPPGLLVPGAVTPNIQSVRDVARVASEMIDELGARGSTAAILLPDLAVVSAVASGAAPDLNARLGFPPSEARSDF